MSIQRDELQPMSPADAQELFLDHKATNCTEATVRNHRYRTNHFVRWCEIKGIENLNDLTGRHLQEYRLWRKEDGDLCPLTVKAQMSTLRVFLKWAASIEAVPSDLYDKIMIPRVAPEERQRDETLDADTAEEILEYLTKYHYGSKKHPVMALLWETGMRIGGVNSLDLDDVYLDEKYLQLEHRPHHGTNLKNGEAGERLVAITPELTQLLEDYITNRRKDQIDDNGREPLLTTTKGRMSRAAIRRHVYQITAPCFRDEPCDGCEDGDKKCDEAVSPHAIRRGSITHYLTEDVPPEVVTDRMNVSRKVLDQHYDKRTEEVKVEQRRSFLDNI